jgi:hypothetical protein
VDGTGNVLVGSGIDGFVDVGKCTTKGFLQSEAEERGRASSGTHSPILSTSLNCSSPLYIGICALASLSSRTISSAAVCLV